MKLTSLLLSFVVAVILGGASARAQQYSVTDLGKVATSSTAHAMNNAGQIVGAIGGAHGDDLTAFFWHGNASRQIGRPSHSDYSEGFAINNAGTVVGSANLPDGMRAFSWTNGGKLSELAPLAGDSSSTAYGINDAGVVVGFSSGPRGQFAVRWQNGAPQSIAPAGVNQSQALAVNSAGSIAGFYGIAENARGFLSLSGTGFQILAPLPGDQSSQALALNDSNAAVGISAAASGLTHAVLWDPANGAVNLGILPGGDHSQAYGINRAGQVVGSSGSQEGMHAFLWTSGTGIVDLNSLLPAGTGVSLAAAVAVNDAGQILAIGNPLPNPNPERDTHLDMQNHSGVTRAYLLTPLQ